MKQCVLVLEFGKNVYNDNLVEYLKPKYIVKRYDLFQDKNIKNHDYSTIDYLILGGAKYTIGINKLLKLPKNATFNPLYEAYAIINQLKHKPILGVGYGCLVLGLYYKCSVDKLSNPNHNRKQHLIIDHRYKINRFPSNESTNMLITFNNKNKLNVPSESGIDVIAFSAENIFDSCGFRFNTKHYGFLFRLIDTKFGKNFLNNFFSYHS